MLGYYLGSENVTKNTPADVKYQKDQLDKINEKEVENNKQEDIDFLEKIADWETYKNEELGFEFKYPKDTVLAENPKFYKPGAFHVYTNDIFEINIPMGFETDNLLKDKSALENNDPTVNFGFAIADSYEIIDDPEILGKKFTILRQLEVCNVQFTREALIYKDNHLIRLHWQYDNINEIINNNSDYFTTNSASCGNSKVWKDENNFYKDLVSSKTDAISQKWFNDFNQIISTFKFTNTDETANWITYSNEKYGYKINYPSEAQITLEKNDEIRIDLPPINSKTGFSDKYIIIKNKTNEICSNPMSTIIKKVSDINLNGIIFIKEIGSEGAAGSIYDSISYSKKRNFKCFSLNLVIRSNGSSEINIEKESEIPEDMLSTLKFTESDKTADWTTYNGSKIKIGSAFSFKYSPKIWDLEEINLIHKNLDKCIFSPGVLWRNRLVNVISSENISFGDYKARKVKIGIKNNASSIDYYFDSETSTVFSLSMPENEKDKTICEEDTEAILNTISF